MQNIKIYINTKLMILGALTADLRVTQEKNLLKLYTKNIFFCKYLNL